MAPPSLATPESASSDPDLSDHPTSTSFTTALRRPRSRGGRSSRPSTADGEPAHGHMERKSRSFFRSIGGARSRSPSPFGGRGRSPSVDRMSLGSRRGDGDISDAESEIVDVRPRTAFDSEEESSEDEQLLGNTEANSSGLTPYDYLSTVQPTVVFAGEGPNLVRNAPGPVFTSAPTPRRKKTKDGKAEIVLSTGRPKYERNRCTVVIDHGDPDRAAANAKRTRTYIVASDLSEEAEYAIEWAIGTVLREGDECLIVSVMETESKMDPDNASASQAEKAAKLKNQKERQETALVLVRQATALLERTKLNVRVTCQAIHARNARHMLVDIIDYIEPTMAIIGSRGLGSLKGALMGSVSNYLVQKSSVPVMVARRRLRKPRTVAKRPSQLNHEPRVPLAKAQIEKESHAATAGSTILTRDEEMEEKKDRKAGIGK